jgi:hypothetical protein
VKSLSGFGVKYWNMAGVVAFRNAKRSSQEPASGLAAEFVYQAQILHPS